MHQALKGLLITLVVAAPATVAAADQKAQSQVERGHYLVQVGGCNDCHTPLMMSEHGPVPDISRALSGHPEGMVLPPPLKGEGPWLWGGAGSMTAFWGPWGLSYSANLTSDKETGIGLWKPEQFVQAMKTGKHLGVGRPILPPMPWPSMSAATEDDLRAIFAYLQSTKPVKNHVPDAVINPPPPAPVPAAMPKL